MLDKFADELREQREKSGLSLQQIAVKTRIDLKFIEAIDKGNFAFLPDLYVKAFVKQFAKTIGLDEILILKKFEAAKEGKELQLEKPVVKEEVKKSEPVKTETSVIEEKKEETVKPSVRYTEPLKTYNSSEEKKNEESEKSKRQLIFFGSAGVALFAAILLIYFLAFHKSSEIIVEETPIEEVIEQGNNRYDEETAETTTDSSAAVQSPDSLYLTFKATDTSWIYLIIDDSVVREVTLYPKSKFTFAASKEFKATVGNSGAVSLQLNNNAVEFTGTIGTVRHFKLDKTGLIYLNASPKSEQ